MAIITRKYEVCDVCKDIEKPATNGYKVGAPGKNVRTIALCNDDKNTPYAELLKLVKADEGRGRRPRTVSVAEVEKIAANGRAKSTGRKRAATPAAV